MNRIIPAIAILGILLVGAPSGAVAQPVDSTLVARYQLAESYLRAAQFDRAIGLLEDLRTRSPGTPLFADRLAEAYESVKRYDDAIALVDERIDATQPTAVLLADRARLLYLKGDEPIAFETWDRAVESQPDAPGAYLAVMRSLMRMRLFERAAAVLELGRERLSNDSLFQPDLGYLYGLIGRHSESVREYVALLGQNPRQLTFVRSRLAQHATDSTAIAAGIAVAERAVRERPLDRPVRELLAWMYLESGRFEAALDANRAIDRLEEEQGHVLFAFAQQASDAGAYDVALEAYREILQRYPDAPSAADARSGMGTMYERRARDVLDSATGDSARVQADRLYRLAIESYDLFLVENPGHPQQPDIRYRRARILHEQFFDLDAAESALEEVIARHPSSAAAEQAEFDLGQIALLRGRLEPARIRFSRLADRLRTGELAEASRYELSLIHFYRGEFEAARALTESMKENTSADVSNDAIGMKVLLVENRGPDSLDTPLRAYARMRLLERQRRHAEALALADSMLATLGDHALVDDFSYGRADLLRDVGRPADAAVAFAEIALAYPDSPFADRGLFAAAEIYQQLLGAADEAAATYGRLLEFYPGSLLATEARSRIRAIRGDGA